MGVKLEVKGVSSETGYCAPVAGRGEDCEKIPLTVCTDNYGPANVMCI